MFYKKQFYSLIGVCISALLFILLDSLKWSFILSVVIIVLWGCYDNIKKEIKTNRGGST